MTIPRKVRYLKTSTGLARSMRYLRFQTVVIMLLLLGMVPGIGSAEFIKTGENVYQDVGGRLKVIATEKGLLILYTPPISLQEFDPTQVKKEGREFSAFLWYDGGSNRYTELWVQKRAYRIEGNFHLRFGKYGSLTVDNTNPYASIVANAGSVNKPNGSLRNYRTSILGFLGVRQIINQTGREAVAVFEADQFNLAGVLEPYLLGKTGVFVEGHEVANDRLGALPDLRKRRHVCLEPDTGKLMPRDLIEIKRQTTSAARIQALNSALLRNKQKNPLTDLLILRVSTAVGLNGVIAFDPTNAELRLVQELKSASKSKQKVCVIESIEFGEEAEDQVPSKSDSTFR